MCSPDMSRRALITGISGQDGSYLAELLVSKGYEVHGVIRRASTFTTERIDHLYEAGDVQLHYGDATDGAAITRLLTEVQPHEVYNLAAQSHVKVSFEVPEYTADVVALGALRLFEAVRLMPADERPRIYQAGSSEMFGAAPPPQNETTRFRPRSPYACAKVFAHNAAVNYRESYGLFIANGILFNHESPRRLPTFVTRKVTQAVARAVETYDARPLVLGNLDAIRDWGHARDYVDAMWRMLQHDTPDDFVVATGEAHSVRELCECAFSYAGLDYREFVETDPRYLRPLEVPILDGDPRKAFEVLGWKATTTFKDLIHEMVDADRALMAPHLAR
jgi:GDPmannose 4,6-dehydratase